MRTGQVAGVLVSSVASIFYIIISTVLQVFIIKTMAKLSKLAPKTTPAPTNHYNTGYRYVDYHQHLQQVYHQVCHLEDHKTV